MPTLANCRPILAMIFVAILATGCYGVTPSTSPDVAAQLSASAVALASSTAGPTPTFGSSPNPAPPVLPTATPEPTYPPYVPDPTPFGALPLRTEVQVNEQVVDRSGVPPDLYDRYWWTGQDAGQFGTTAQIGVPAGEDILTVADGLAVSARRNGDEPRTLIVRDFTTGALVRELDTEASWLSAVVVDTRLFWTGLTGDDADPYAVYDAGVWSVDVASDDPPEAIVEPGKSLDGGLCGRNLALSASGQTLLATAPCMGRNGWTDVIDVETRSRTVRLRDTHIHALIDDTFVAWDGTPTDGITWGLGGVTAYDLATGAVRWRFPDPSDVDRFVLYQVRPSAAGFLIEYGWRTQGDSDKIIAVLDPADGHRRVLVREEYNGGYDYMDQSSAGHIVLRSDSATITQEPTPISLIRIADGALLVDAFMIDPPWLCFDEYCLAD